MNPVRYLVSVTTPDKDDCGNKIAPKTEGEIRRAVSKICVDSSVYVNKLPDEDKTDKKDFKNWQYLLSLKDLCEAKNYTAKIHWGFNRQSLTKLIERFERGRIKTKCKVLFILEDCNYPCASLIAEGKVKETYEWIKQNLV